MPRIVAPINLSLDADVARSASVKPKKNEQFLDAQVRHSDLRRAHVGEAPERDVARQGRGAVMRAILSQRGARHRRRRRVGAGSAHGGEEGRAERGRARRTRTSKPSSIPTGQQPTAAAAATTATQQPKTAHAGPASKPRRSRPTQGCRGKPRKAAPPAPAPTPPVRRRRSIAKSFDYGARRTARSVQLAAHDERAAPDDERPAAHRRAVRPDGAPLGRDAARCSHQRSVPGDVGSTLGRMRVSTIRIQDRHFHDR